MNPKRHSARNILLFSVVLLPLIATAVLRATTNRTATAGNNPVVEAGDSEATLQIEINLDQALRVSLPNPRTDLRPASFKTPDGKSGWVLRIPGGHAIATPAYSDGMLFVGGGYGSHEFYAFNALTGAMVWRSKTSDDGPSAAVVENGFVAFNTESCTVVVCQAKTGEVVWQEWLGDPLMSQPAIANGRLYIAYPGGQRGHKHAGSNTSSNSVSSPGTSHRLLCADLRSGRHIWEQEIAADVISAPVISGNQVFVTCFDGTSYSFDASTGATIWTKNNGGTSAPLVVNGEVLITQKELRQGKDYEGLQRIDLKRGEAKEKKLIAAEEAKYLGENKGGGVAIKGNAQAAADAAVGFAAPPPAAKLSAANKHLGVNTVVGGWAYQGSRATYKAGRMMNAQGRFINSVKSADGGIAWKAEVKGAAVADDAQVFSPPALGERNMYLCSAVGHILSMTQKTGEVKFIYSTTKDIAFQPALAKGSVFFGTVNGLLICLRTGDNDADGWYAWGGNAQHNR